MASGSDAPAPVEILQRKGFGGAGRSIRLLCNHFKVRCTLKESVYQYSVAIEPAITQKGLRRVVMSKLLETFGQVELQGKRFAYDGENCLFTVGELQFKSREFPVILDDKRKTTRAAPAAGGAGDGGDEDDDGGKKKRRVGSRGREFSVKVEKSAVVNMGAIEEILRGRKAETAQDALRVLDIVLREHAATRGYLLVRESYFHGSLGKVGDLGDGVQSWPGFHVSFRPTLAGLTLNFDSSTTTVIKPGPVIEYLQDNFKKNVSSFRPEDWQKARRLLKGVRVESSQSKVQQSNKIIGFSSEPCEDLKFTKRVREEDGNFKELPPISVAEHFANMYNYTLRHPQLPALDVGNTKKPIYLPMEVCSITPGQRYMKSLTSSQRANHIGQSRQSPDDRKKLVKQALQSNEYEKNDLVKAFGIQVDRDLAVIQGRILDAPAVRFGREVEEVPRNGRWNYNSKNLMKGAEVANWAVLCFNSRTREPEAKGIGMQLKECCNRKGMNMQDPMAIILERPNMQGRAPGDRVENAIGQLRNACKAKPRLIVCILPDKNSDLYAPIKRITETSAGIISQCIVPPRPLKDQYLTNVSLKINIKLGGYNSLLSLEHKKCIPKVSSVPTIIFGMDVSHGSPGDADSPSIAAVVASRGWPRISQYAARLRSQPSRTEMIDGLYEEEGGKEGGMIRDHLVGFYQSCRNECPDPKPKQIIIFRDGVSESQFEQVLMQELPAFKKAISSLPGCTAKITLIIVQKRHHTRFFPEGSGNVVPGTIIDRDVVHPRNFDFYLCSHAGLIGTTRPTHYHVLYDENNFSPDEIQNLSNSLCYTYAKCTTAVSVVPPAYYAHLAATHGRCYLETGGDSETSSRSHSRTGAAAGRHQELPKLVESMQNCMFFC